MKHLVFVFAVTLIQCQLVYAKRLPKFNPVLNPEWKNAFRAETGIGCSFSFPGGSYIRKFKNTYNVDNEILHAEAKVRPLINLTGGIYLGYKPFIDSSFSKLTILGGLQYYQRGYTLLYSQRFNHANKAIEDVTDYREKFTMHMIGLPLVIRYGNRAFVEMGLVLNQLIIAHKKSVIQHEQEGSDAYLDGFSIQSKERLSLKDAGMKRQSVNIRLGTGLAISQKLSLQVNWMLLKNNYMLQDDLQNHLLQLQVHYQLNPKKHLSGIK